MIREMQNGSLEARNITVLTVSPQTKKPVFVETTIFGKGDPGHTLTTSAFIDQSLPPGCFLKLIELS